jgi:xylan 1,4-beta-xylosidase
MANNIFFKFLVILSLCVSLSITLDTIQYNADLKKTTKWEHYWERCVGSGHALLGTRQDWRDALKIAHDKLGFERVRFHGIFDDEMNVYHNGPNYSFYNVDQVYDYLVSIGMSPIVELGFMPSDMASGNKTIFYYKGNITPPKDYTLWHNLIVTFVKHLIDRYGMDRVSKWHFEIWNEPNCGFWSGSQTEYFHLLQVTSAAIKSVSKNLSVGGPATCQSAWIPETLKFIKENNVSLDFISTHEYPTDKGPKRNTMFQVLTKSREMVGNTMPLFYTEYNDGLFAHSLHDTIYASAFAIFNIIDVYGIADIFAWWTFSDVFEEGGQQSVPFNQGYGLQTIYNIPKPSFKAFELLHETGDERAHVDGPNHPTVGTLVTKGKQEIMVIVYNHNVPNALIQTNTVSITLNNVPSTIKDANIRRIDEHNSNPIVLWQQMGSPTYPSQKQIQQLHSSAEFITNPIQYKTLTNNSIQFQIDIPPQGIAAIKFKY